MKRILVLLISVLIFGSCKKSKSDSPYHNYACLRTDSLGYVIHTCQSDNAWQTFFSNPQQRDTFKQVTTDSIAHAISIRSVTMVSYYPAETWLTCPGIPSSPDTAYTYQRCVCTEY